MDTSCELPQRLYSIGIMININKRRVEVDIERSLLIAAKEIDSNLRLLSQLLTWVKVHGERVNTERLRKLLKEDSAPWIGLLAVFGVYCKQSRWRSLVSSPVTLLSNGDLEANRLRAELKGEESWSKGTGFLIPKGSEPVDSKWILSPEQLARFNRHYHNKLIYGSNWRADIVTAFEAGATTPTEAARMCGSSYEPAHRVWTDLTAAGILKKEVG